MSATDTWVTTEITFSWFLSFCPQCYEFETKMPSHIPYCLVQNYPNPKYVLSTCVCSCLRRTNHSFSVHSYKTNARDEMSSPPSHLWQPMIPSLLNREEDEALMISTSNLTTSEVVLWPLNVCGDTLEMTLVKTASLKTTAQQLLTFMSLNRTMGGILVILTGTQVGFSNYIHIPSKLLCILCSGDICYG